MFVEVILELQNIVLHGSEEIGCFLGVNVWAEKFGVRIMYFFYQMRV